MSQLNNEIKVGGTLERVIRCRDGHVFEQNKHNTIVDQGMHMMLKVPEENTHWYTKNIVNSNSITSCGNIFKGIVGFSSENSIYVAHTGIAMFMACGSSDAATTNDMTQLTSFAGDPIDGMSYGSTKGGYFKYNQQLSGSNIVFTAKYRYSYTATSSFTCKEFGTYTLLMTSVPASSADYDTWSSYTPKLFSRVVLTEPLEMTAGETYTFDYTLRFSMSYSNTYITHDDIFGLHTVKYEKCSSDDVVETSSEISKNLSQFISTTDHSKVFSSGNFYTGILSSSKYVINMLNNGAGFSVENNTRVLYAYSSILGMNFAPVLFWNNSNTLAVTGMDIFSIPTIQYNSFFNVTKSMPVKRQPDEVGDFYSVMTYTYTIPYSDTTGKYLAIWTPMCWYAINATLDETGNLTWNPYPRNNHYEYTLTCKTVLTREE